MEPVDVLASLFEYRAEFKEPALDIWNYREFNSVMFRAFRQWNIGLSDITWNPNPTNAAEVQSKFELFKGRYVFTVGYGSIGFSVVNPFWNEAEQISQVLSAGATAVLKVTKTEIAHQSVHLSMHLKPQRRPISEITSGFLNPTFSTASEEIVRACGFSLYTENCIKIIDLSALNQNALYIQLARNFGPLATIEEMAKTLADDQNKFLERLELEIVEKGE